MKKPYIKKFSIISDFDVWIVNGEYIRNKIDEEFTNFGQHYQFKFIPKNEFWIDKENKPGEEHFYMDIMLLMYRLMSKGMSREKAAKLADKLERKERAKSKLMQRELKKKKHKSEILKDVHERLIKKYSNKKIKVWIVNGELVRDLFFLDFTEGGHGFVYPFVPKDEVWIDNDVKPNERKFVLLHELYERNLMAKGMKYIYGDRYANDAHKKASEIEFYCRLHPKKLSENLKKEIEKNDN